MATNDMLLGFEGYETRSLIYKVVDGLEVSLDVLYPSKPLSTPTPVLIHYHGGFLVTGDRYTFPPYWLIKACVDRGWAFVTPDYRLIPETTGHDCVRDAVDAYHWTLDSLSSHVEINVGPAILAGSSAGGYLTLAVASITDRKPAAILSVYGMLDPTDKRYLTKGSNIFKRPLEDTAPALAELKATRSSKPKVLSGYPAGPSPDSRFAIISALHIEAIYPDVLTGVPGLAEAIRQKGVEAIPAEARDLFPLTFGSLTQLPLVLLIHGKNDSAVPYNLSKTAFEKLQQDGVDVHAEFPEDAEHGFDVMAGKANIERDDRARLSSSAFDGLRNILKQLDQAIGISSNP